MVSEPRTQRDYEPRQKRLYWRAITMITLAVGILAAAIQYQALTLPKSNGSKLQATDALIVATGGQARISAGLNLMEKGLAKRMLLTGVGAGITKKILTESLPISNTQDAQLICCVDLDFTAADTAGNASASLKWMNANDFDSLRLVTANYHMARAKLEFERYMPDIDIYYFAVSPPDLDADSWYYSWPVAKLLMRESGKYIAARLRHMTSRQIPS